MHALRTFVLILREKALKQSDGVTIGSSLASVLADVFLDMIEPKVFDNILKFPSVNTDVTLTTSQFSPAQKKKKTVYLFLIFYQPDVPMD